MQIHPLFSVKKAAEVLGVDKQFLRDQLEVGSIRGEQRRVGERDKWFIYHGEVRDLRDTKRLHELLEKAKRISTEDLEDFFQPEIETEIGSVGDDAVFPANAELNQQLTLDPVAAAERMSPAELTAAEVFTGSDARCTVEVLSPSDIPLEAEIETVMPEIQVEVEAELEHFNESVSGSTSITLDEVLQKLTVEFAYRLSEERTRVCELEQLLEQKEESLRQLPDLEKQLKIEQETRRSHEDEVATLQQKIRLLEEKQLAPKKSWWQSLFG